MTLPRPSRSLSIGNLSFTFSFPSAVWLSFFQKYYGPFLDQKHRTAVRVKVSPLAAAGQEELSVALNEEWEIRRSDFVSAAVPDFSHAELSVDRNRYSFDSWLRVYCTLYGLSKNALLVHSAGFCLEGSTFLFPGRSGRGKSTLIRLLGKNGALSDELTMIYRQGSSWHGTSTPFWGELKKGNGRLYNGRLKGIFFLEHGNTVRKEPLDRRDALKRLLATILFFSKETETAARLLSLVDSVLKRVPAYVLTFARDSRSGDIIECLRRTA